MKNKKFHLEQINRFHKKFNQISKNIHKVRRKFEDLTNDDRKLFSQYQKLVQMMIKIDHLCKYDIKNNIDIIEND